MTDVSAHPTGAGLNDIWASLARYGYALTSDQALALPEKFRENFWPTYFNDQVLHHDDGDMPADRQRARDVIGYRWCDGQLELEEHETITITDRASIPGKRDHARVMLLEDPQAEDLVHSLLNLVPPEWRKSHGTFGVNLFRTFTNVVSKPHHDHEEFIILYVLDRVGEGAKSYLYRPEDVSPAGKPTGKPVFNQQLNSGEILIFKDENFMHGATKLKPGPEGMTRRDVLVCTVDYPETYLKASSVN
jgi:hypothetical protein